MFKLCFVFLLVTLSLLPSLSHADCCTSKQVFFKTKTKDCKYYDGYPVLNIMDEHSYSYDTRVCTINLCDDGKPISGVYCGKGPCNIFGCNCNGGCIQGNVTKNFYALHGDDVYHVRY